TSNSTRSPCCSERKPSPEIALKWTKMSSPESSWMKPNPLLSLNHFTAPCIRPPPPPPPPPPPSLRAGALRGGWLLERGPRPSRPPAGLPPSRSPFISLKQSRQYTGRAPVGTNGTVVSAPQREHTAACISRPDERCGDPPPPPDLSDFRFSRQDLQ